MFVKLIQARLRVFFINKTIPGGATKYSSTFSLALFSSSFVQLPSVTSSSLRYRDLENKGCWLVFTSFCEYEVGISKAGFWCRVRREASLGCSEAINATEWYLGSSVCGSLVIRYSQEGGVHHCYVYTFGSTPHKTTIKPFCKRSQAHTGGGSQRASHANKPRLGIEQPCASLPVL